MLLKETTYSWYRHLDIEFGQYFTKNYQVVYCSNIDGFVKAMGIDYCISDWRLFIDSSNKSLKAVVLFNRNKVSSIPASYSISMSENYNNMIVLLSWFAEILRTLF